MPIYLDAHFSSVLPLDLMREFLVHARRGTRDGHGVRALDLYCGEDGTVYYLAWAPDEDALRDYHAARGLDCVRLRQVNLFGSNTDDLSEDHKTLVRHMIVGEQAVPTARSGAAQGASSLHRPVI